MLDQTKNFQLPLPDVQNKLSANLAALAHAVDDALYAMTNGALHYRGAWDANANNPFLVSGGGSEHPGNYYVVSVSGNTNLDGITDWVVGDWAIFNGTVWEKADHTDVVTSVFGRQGAVVAAFGDYLASLISNDSLVAGVSVKDALNWLLVQAPLAHHLTHESGGSDQISVAGLSGLLVTPQTPAAHKGTHVFGGADAFAAADLLDAVVRRLRESGGPTDLALGAIPDTNVLRRAGANVTGIAPGTLVGSYPPQAHAASHKHGGADEVATATPAANQIVKALATGLIADGWLSLAARFRCWSSTFGSNTAAGYNIGAQVPTLIRIKTFAGTDLFGAPTKACCVAMSSSGQPGYLDLYRPSTGTVILTIGPITSLTPVVYQFTFPLANPLPTTEEALEIRGYRGPGATTMTFYDFTLGG